MITEWSKLEPTQLLALKMTSGEPTVAVRASMIRALKGDGSAAIILTQLLYWSQTDIARDNGGWFYMTTRKISTDLGISRHIQTRVRQLLTERGILETVKRGLPAKNFYRLHLDVIVDMLERGWYEPETDEQDEENTDSGEASTEQPEDEESAEGSTESGPTVVRKEDDIRRILRRTGVKIYEKKDTNVAVKQPVQKDFHALSPDRFERAVSFVTATYPVDGQNLPVSEGEARAAVRKIGSIPAKAGDIEARKIRDRLQSFFDAVGHIKQALEIKQLDPQYVPGFGKFAGLGITYGAPPQFEKWALWTPVVEKQKLVV